MSNDIADRVKKIVVEHLGVDDAKVGENASFIDDLGADSLDTVELVLRAPVLRLGRDDAGIVGRCLDPRPGTQAARQPLRAGDLSLEDLGNIGEFVSAVAVVVSLLYLAMQIRQNTKSVQTSAYQAVLDSAHRVNEYFADLFDVVIGIDLIGIEK